MRAYCHTHTRARALSHTITHHGTPSHRCHVQAISTARRRLTFASGRSSSRAVRLSRWPHSPSDTRDALLLHAALATDRDETDPWRNDARSRWGCPSDTRRRCWTVACSEQYCPRVLCLCPCPCPCLYHSTLFPPLSLSLSCALDSTLVFFCTCFVNCVINTASEETFPGGKAPAIAHNKLGDFMTLVWTLV